MKITHLSAEEHPIIRRLLEGGVSLSHLEIIDLSPPPLPDYLAAMEVAVGEAERRLGEPMLLSWYDRDRDFESPQHASECHEASAIPGYVDYGISHGATLLIDIESGRFLFFFLEAAS